MGGSDALNALSDLAEVLRWRNGSSSPGVDTLQAPTDFGTFGIGQGYHVVGRRPNGTAGVHRFQPHDAVGGARAVNETSAATWVADSLQDEET